MEASVVDEPAEVHHLMLFPKVEDPRPLASSELVQ